MTSGKQSENDVDLRSAEPTTGRKAVEAAAEANAPVFVDATGRRRRRVRLVCGVIGLVAVSYTVVVGLSLLGVPISPQGLLPTVISEKTQPAADEPDREDAYATPTASTRARQLGPVPIRTTTTPAPAKARGDQPGALAEPATPTATTTPAATPTATATPTGTPATGLPAPTSEPTLTVPAPLPEMTIPNPQQPMTAAATGSPNRAATSTMTNSTATTNSTPTNGSTTTNSTTTTNGTTTGSAAGSIVPAGVVGPATGSIPNG
jgi:hypothetical protein